MPRRPIVLALLVAAITTGAILVVVRGPDLVASLSSSTGAHAAVGSPAPPVMGTTLDGAPFDLAAYAGKPVVINFWGPSCVPCRTEFPILAAKAREHAADGLVIVGVLTDDPPDGARAFVSQYGATWPTVIDPGAAIKAAYQVVARPQSYFVDRAGNLRSIQIGEVRDADFERQYAAIAGGT
jgi:cytochrome c biogenesis protein CcmG/thiol:disulfide interchange protein DsbE